MTRRRYTEDQFRAAVADPATKTIADLCRALGLVPRGGNYEVVLEFAESLDISVARLRRPTARNIDDATFLAAIDAANGYADLARRLGLRPHQNSNARVRARARMLGRTLPEAWSTPGPRRRTADGAARPFCEAAVRRAVLGNFSIADVLRDMGHRPRASTYARFAASVQEYELDTSHFGSPGHHTGQEVAAVAKLLTYGALPPFCALARRLVRIGIKHWACERCGRQEWQGEQIPLELDHVNGDRRDNQLVNLRLLCPNCHALTPTFRSRNWGRRDVPPQQPEPLRATPAGNQLRLL